MSLVHPPVRSIDGECQEQDEERHQGGDHDGDGAVLAVCAGCAHAVHPSLTSVRRLLEAHHGASSHIRARDAAGTLTADERKPGEVDVDGDLHRVAYPRVGVAHEVDADGRVVAHLSGDARCP